VKTTKGGVLTMDKGTPITVGLTERGIRNCEKQVIQRGERQGVIHQGAPENGPLVHTRLSDPVQKTQNVQGGKKAPHSTGGGGRGENRPEVALQGTGKELGEIASKGTTGG